MTGGRRGRSALGPAVGLVLVAALALLVSTAGDWATGVVPRPAPLPAETVSAGAADAAPGLRALGLVVLASAAALLATRGAGRTAVGLVLVAVSVVAAARSVLPALDPGRALDAGTTGAAGTFRPWLAVAGAAAGVVGGLLTVAHGRSWPALGRRFDAPAARREGVPAGGAAPGPGAAPPRADVDGAGAWDALDRGEDPTGG